MIFKNGIHVWINNEEPENSSLLILMSFIISGHPDWRKANIKVFETCKPGQYNEIRMKLTELVKTGRLPITEKNIEIITEESDMTLKSLINQKSSSAALIMTGFSIKGLKHSWESLLNGYDETGTMLLINSHSQKEIV